MWNLGPSSPVPHPRAPGTWGCSPWRVGGGVKIAIYLQHNHLTLDATEQPHTAASQKELTTHVKNKNQAGNSLPGFPTTALRKNPLIAQARTASLCLARQ